MFKSLGSNNNLLSTRWYLAARALFIYSSHCRTLSWTRNISKPSDARAGMWCRAVHREFKPIEDRFALPVAFHGLVRTNLWTPGSFCPRDSHFRRGCGYWIPNNSFLTVFFFQGRNYQKQDYFQKGLLWVRVSMCLLVRELSRVWTQGQDPRGCRG